MSQTKHELSPVELHNYMFEEFSSTVESVTPLTAPQVVAHDFIRIVSIEGIHPAFTLGAYVLLEKYFSNRSKETWWKDLEIMLEVAQKMEKRGTTNNQPKPAHLLIASTPYLNQVKRALYLNPNINPPSQTVINHLRVLQESERGTDIYYMIRHTLKSVQIN